VFIVDYKYQGMGWWWWWCRARGGREFVTATGGGGSCDAVRLPMQLPPSLVRQQSPTIALLTPARTNWSQTGWAKQPSTQHTNATVLPSGFRRTKRKKKEKSYALYHYINSLYRLWLATKKEKFRIENNRSSPLKENIVRFLMGGENIFIFIFHLSLNPEKNVGSKKINIEWRYYFLLLHVSIAKRKKKLGIRGIYVYFFIYYYYSFFLPSSSS
jgi:hypothetical protein